MLYEDRIKQRINECVLPTEFIETIKRWQTVLKTNPALINHIIGRLEKVAENNQTYSNFYDRILEDLEDIHVRPNPKPLLVKKRESQVTQSQIKTGILKEILKGMPEELAKDPSNLYLVEKFHVLKVMQTHSFNRMKTADDLKISYRGLRFKLNNWIKKFKKNKSTVES